MYFIERKFLNVHELYRCSYRDQENAPSLYRTINDLGHLLVLDTNELKPQMEML